MLTISFRGKPQIFAPILTDLPTSAIETDRSAQSLLKAAIPSIEFECFEAFWKAIL